MVLFLITSMACQKRNRNVPTWRRLALAAVVWIAILPAAVLAQSPATKPRPQPPRNAQRAARADFQEPATPELFGGQNSAVNVAFLQEVIVKGKLRLDKAAADQSVRSQTAGFQVDRAQLLTAIRKEYYETVAAKQRLLLAQYIIQVARRSLNVSKQLQEAGEGTLTDVLLLDSELQRAYLAYDNAKSLLAGEYKQLAAAVGVPELEIQDIEGSLFDPPPEFDEDQIRAFLSTESSIMAGSRAELVKSKVLLRRAEV